MARDFGRRSDYLQHTSTANRISGEINYQTVIKIFIAVTET